MRLKLSSRNWAKRGFLNIPFLLCFLLSCTSSTSPTYVKENIDQAIRDICKKEYDLDIRARIIGSTLWVYMPIQDMFEAFGKKDKPEKYVEKFAIEQNNDSLKNNLLKLEYAIKAVPEKEKYQEYKYNKKVFDNINNVLAVIRRVLFSMDRSKAQEPKFFCFITADIKNGIEIKQLSYYLDLKKISYNYISNDEYRHRLIQDFNIEPRAIGDSQGSYIEYRDITMEEFITGQIKHRIQLKFQKPEVEKDVDIDKEIIKILTYTLKIYGFDNFDTAELNNLLTQNRIVLNRMAIWERPIEQKF